MNRLFWSYTALRVWAVVGMGWTTAAAAVAVFVASAALLGHLNRVEYAQVPPGTTPFVGTSSAPSGWVEAVVPAGFEVHQTSGGSSSGSGPDRDVTPPGAWHTVRLRSHDQGFHSHFTLLGHDDRAALREHFDEPFRDAVRAALAAWEPGVTVTPLDAPDPPTRFAPAADADADVWGLAYSAERAGAVHEGTVVWTLTPSDRLKNGPDGVARRAFVLIVETNENHRAAL